MKCSVLLRSFVEKQVVVIGRCCLVIAVVENVIFLFAMLGF